jgi:hypothetical protein
MDKKCRFILKSKDTTYGDILIDDVEFPWYYGEWEPTERFKTIKPVFEADVQAMNRQESAAIEGATKEIRKLELKILSEDSRHTITDPLIHIDKRRAWFK